MLDRYRNSAGGPVMMLDGVIHEIVENLFKGHALYLDPLQRWIASN